MFLKIAIFDSGIGGLSVLNAALKRFRGVEFLYYADTKNVPYGVKSRADVEVFSVEACKFLINHGAKALVVACNTATSVAINTLRDNFNIPIIGMEPAIKLASEKFPNSIILLIATPLTIKGKKLQDLIKKVGSEVWLLALPRLVEFAQRQEFKSYEVKKYLQDELGNFKLQELSSLVLGCTHFNYFKDTLREILPPSVALIDGIDGTVNHLINRLGGVSDFGGCKNSVRYFDSGEELDISIIGNFLKRLDDMKPII